ncbi:MAG: hypothetical protein AAGB31_12825, partial [Bdellovibrio sp.]
TQPGIAWAGMSHRVFTVKDTHYLEKQLGPIQCQINGQFARGGIPPGASTKTTLKDLWVIAPFLLKGFILKKWKGSPFFKEDGKTPIFLPEILSLEQRNQLRQKLG